MMNNFTVISYIIIILLLLLLFPSILETVDLREYV
jgi:hypothetical protein